MSRYSRIRVESVMTRCLLQQEVSAPGQVSVSDDNKYQNSHYMDMSTRLKYLPFYGLWTLTTKQLGPGLR